MVTLLHLLRQNFLEAKNLNEHPKFLEFLPLSAPQDFKKRRQKVLLGISRHQNFCGSHKIAPFRASGCTCSLSEWRKKAILFCIWNRLDVLNLRQPTRVGLNYTLVELPTRSGGFPAINMFWCLSIDLFVDNGSYEFCTSIHIEI